MRSSGPRSRHDSSPEPRSIARRGFSLVESVIALGILALVFTAIASAIGAGTASAGETRSRVVATLAADELLAEILTSDWDELEAWNGFSEAAGEGVAPDGRKEPARNGISRRARIIDETRSLQPVGIDVDGRTILIEVHDRDERLLARLERFIPEPTGDDP